MANKKLTIVYGGAFNPPTKAHQKMLKAVVDYAEQVNADVWILPSGDRVDKTIMTSMDLRLQYIDALVKDCGDDDNRVSVILTELNRTCSVETYDTIIEFNSDFPEREFVWVFGADSTLTMPSWKQGSWILENVSMFVFERPGSRINSAAVNAVKIDMPVMDVSSTAVRERLASGEAFDHLVGPEVHKLLLKSLVHAFN